MLSTQFLSSIDYKQGQTVAVAVSGGADSLALLFMACEKLGAQNVVAITFDHKLRKESYREALYVRSQCEQLGCRHILLQWDERNPLKASQNEARKARYDHLSAYCYAYDIPYLFLAHHYDDQAETYYIRLYQKSHLWGLAGMAFMQQKTERLKIVRPLLQQSSAALKDYLRQKNIQWIEDPSNHKEKYLRVKIRRLLRKKKLESPLLAPIQSYRQNMLICMQKWLQNYGQSKGAGLLILDKQAFDKAALELRLHLLRYCIQAVGHGAYGLSLQELEAKYNAILSPQLFSISHCFIFSDAQKIYIQHEYRKPMQHRKILRQKNALFYDDRFHIFYPQNMKIDICYLGDLQKTSHKEIQQLIDLSRKKKYRYICSLPLVKHGERTLIIPSIEKDFWQQNKIFIRYNQQMQTMACQKYFIGLSF